MSEHTPGPWFIQNAREGPIGVGKTGEGLICFLYSKPTNGEREANAHLIAAAPDLLAACKDTRDWLSSFSMPPTSTIQEKQEAIARLDRIIAKAEPGEGRQP